jgi:hypothetical protein
MSAAPDFLTLKEAAKVIRLKRTASYRLAGKSTGLDDDELPTVRFGKQIRVPRVRLEQLLGGPLTWPPVEVDEAPPASPDTPPPPPKRGKRTPEADARQGSLPLDE